MIRNFVFGSAAMLIGIAPCLAQEASSAIYKSDAKFADVFGRPVQIESNGRTLANPTFAEIEQASRGGASNAMAKDAVNALRASVMPGPSACKDMMSLKLPWVRMLSAEDVPAKDGTRAYCKVLGVIDKEINFEVDMPLPTEWNGKYLMGGNGGFLGNLINLTGKSTLERAYAIAITDTGHMTPKDAGASWAYRNPERVANYGHRGTHLAALNSKLIIQAYYKKPIQRSYFFGQSGSGRPAMMEAQRYPDDFEGIVAACPAFSWTTGIGVSFAWTQQLMYKSAQDQYDFKPVMPGSKVAALDAAIYAKCDAVDGLKDDVITNPLACKFDPTVDLKICKAGEDKPDCFTKEQAEVIKKIHDGPSNSAGKVWSNWAYGGENIPGQWTAPPGASGYIIGSPKVEVAASAGGMDIVRGAFSPYRSRHYLLGNETLRWLVNDNPDYDLHSFNFETDMPTVLAAAAQIDAVDPDMSAFKKRGGKIIMGIGWSDWCCNAVSLKDYYDAAVQKTGGLAQTQDFARLFLLPGVGHCFSMDPARKTTNFIDYLTALEQWVEQGTAPASIVAAHVAMGKSDGAPDGVRMPKKENVDRTRPICAYPAAAAYKGSGSIDDAANFTCRTP